MDNGMVGRGGARAFIVSAYGPLRRLTRGPDEARVPRPPGSLRMDVECGVREEILRACFDVFARRGIRAPGLDELAAEAGVTEPAFRRCLGSKDAAAEAYLRHLYLAWAGAFEAAVAVRGEEGPWALLGLFDAVEVLCGSERASRASLVHVLGEFGSGHPLGQSAIRLSALLRSDIARLAGAAGLLQAEEFAKDCQLLLAGCTLSGSQGIRRAVEDAKRIAETLIRSYVQTEPTRP